MEESAGFKVGSGRNVRRLRDVTWVQEIMHGGFRV